MSNEMHPDCRARLKERLVKLLAGARVTHGKFLDRRSLDSEEHLDDSLPQRNRKEAQAWISSEPLKDFAYSRLSEKLQDRPFNSAQEPEELAQIPDFTDAEAISATLLDEFESLPWSYTTIVPTGLPITETSSLVVGDGFRFSPSVSLIPGISIPSEFHRVNNRHIIPPFLMPDDPAGSEAWRRDDLYYLILSTSGFLPDHFLTSSAEELRFLLRTFYGTCMAIGLFKRRWSHRLVDSEKPLFLFHHGERALTNKMPLVMPSSYSEVIDDIAWRDLHPTSERHEDRKRIMKKRFELCRAILAQDSMHAQRLRLASQWYFDGLAAPETLIALIQAMISLEILLGEKATSDVTGIGVLLGNRCAYLLGETHSERQEIIDNFGRIYETRSKIVHRGKNRLEGDELTDLAVSRHLCERIILKEANLLAKVS